MTTPLMNQLGIVKRNIERADPDAAERLGTFGAATVHEAMGRVGLMKPYMRPIYSGAQVGGTAVTVFDVEPEFGDPPDATLVAADLRRMLQGRLDVEDRLDRRARAVRPRAASVPAPKVSLVDCLIYASARRLGIGLITLDADLEGLPGVEVLGKKA